MLLEHERISQGKLFIHSPPESFTGTLNGKELSKPR